MKTLALTSILTALLALASTNAHAADILAKITANGTVLPGDANGRADANKIRVSDFRFAVAVARGAGTGQATGRRQYEPVQITKALGVASPQLLRALVNSEIVTVELEFFRTNDQNVRERYYTIKLENAVVSAISNRSGDTKNAGEAEDVQFTFAKITVTNVLDGSNLQDNVATAP